jgi:WS/DGAT/MGAT family acyltransferase
MAPMPMTDAMFLLAERRGQPMHVGGLQLFGLPEGAGREFLVDLYRQAVEVEPEHVHPLFTRRAHRPLTSLGQWSWTHDDQIDLEHHVRHSALPAPGRVRELLQLASRLHQTLLDRNRPLWEGHLIEGLEGNSFAVYTKFHHALIDGVSALRLLQDSLTEDPDRTDVPPPWAMPVRGRKEKSATNVLPSAGGVVQAVRMVAGNVAETARAVGVTAQEAVREQLVGLATQAPKSILNGSITGSRRFAAQSFAIERIKQVGKAAGATLNDVVLAMSAGALRAYLDELDALPDEPLIAMVPVSLRSAEEARAAGNAVGMILCELATDEADPARRLERIVASTTAAKERMQALGATQNMVLAGLSVAPRFLASSLLGDSDPLRPAFNVTISNVPGPRNPLYWNGAQLQGVYPLSIPLEGQALNITVTSYVEHLEFGLIGCRQRMPHLQRLLGHLEASLDELVSATGA